VVKDFTEARVLDRLLMFSRQTNPISDGDDAGQVLSEAGVTDDSSPKRPEKTKPISQGASSLKCQVSSEESQLAEPPGLPTSRCQLHAATWSRRQTNPISDGDDAGQVLAEAGVTDDSSGDGLQETKPICPAKAGPHEVWSLQHNDDPQGVVVQNEANLEGRSCETKPISGYAGRAGATRRRTPFCGCSSGP
jgi:hypothetical protein